MVQNLPTQLSVLFSFFRMFQVPWQSPARTWLAAQLPERPMRGPSIGHRLFEALGALGPLRCDFDAVNAREVHLPTKKHQKNRATPPRCPKSNLHRAVAWHAAPQKWFEMEVEHVPVMIWGRKATRCGSSCLRIEPRIARSLSYKAFPRAAHCRLETPAIPTGIFQSHHLDCQDLQILKRETKGTQEVPKWIIPPFQHLPRPATEFHLHPAVLPGSRPVPHRQPLWLRLPAPASKFPRPRGRSGDLHPPERPRYGKGSITLCMG